MAKKKSATSAHGTTDALSFIASSPKTPLPAICVAFGAESFLRQHVRRKIRELVLPGEEDEFSLSNLPGKSTPWRDVTDELRTVGLFGGSGRLVIVEEANELVTNNRPAVEDYVDHPARGSHLLLEVDTWPKNTRLYKRIDVVGLQVDCAKPRPAKLTSWLPKWAKQAHQAALDMDAADLLLEIVGPELGLLDQELAKLAAAIPPGQTITAEHVHELTGGWRAKTTWDMLDAATAGNAAEALVQLERLLTGGEHPVAILAQIGSTLRRFAAATRLIEQGTFRGRDALSGALKQAGFKPFVLSKAEPQLRQLGRQRGSQLYRWLLEVDLQLKGSSQLAPRTVLERLIVKMSKQAPMASANRTS